MSGAILGALRSGRYATRSIATPRKPEPAIETANIRMMSGTSGMVGERAPPKATRTP